jgi:hypothetical protein
MKQSMTDLIVRYGPLSSIPEIEKFGTCLSATGRHGNDYFPALIISNLYIINI